MASRDSMSLGEALVRLKSAPTDENAWTVVYTLMWPLVYAVVYRRLRGSHGLAEDAAQEVFLRMVRSPKTISGLDERGARSYLWKVADNVAKDYVVAASRRGSQYMEDIAAHEEIATSGGPSPEQSAERQEFLSRLASRLDERDQKIVSLLVRGAGLREVVAETGMNYHTAGVRLFRLRQRLRKYLEMNE